MSGSSFRAWFLAAVVTVAQPAFGCDEPASDAADAGPFELFIWANAHTAEPVTLWLNGQPVTAHHTVTLGQEFYDSYETALASSVTLETRTPAGAVIDRCVLHAGACDDACVPSRETIGICVFDDQRLWLHDWDCPCDDKVGDWSCSGACSETGPQ